jgi:hypothetical protein
MIVFLPYSWVPSEDVITNVPAEGQDVWESDRRYAEKAIVSESDKLWIVNVVSSDPTDPLSTDPTLYNENQQPSAGTIVPAGYEDAGSLWWRDVTDDPYIENRYRMFGSNPGSVTESPTDIQLTLTAQESFDSIALFNVYADSVSISTVGYEKIVSLLWNNPISESFPNKTSVALVDLPEVPAGSTLDVTINGGINGVSVGFLGVGKRVYIGDTLYGTEISIVDYSRKDREFDGTIATLVERGYTDVANYRFRIASEDIYAVKLYLASIRAKFAVFVGDPDRPETVIYGLYYDLLIPVEDRVWSEANLQVESIVQDSPQPEAPSPNSVTFIEPDGTTCIESFSSSASLCLTDDQLTESVVATHSVTLQPGDVIDWSITWNSGYNNESIAYSTDTLITDCDQTFSTLIWPATVPCAAVQGTAEIGATITHADESITELSPAFLVVGLCNPCEGGTGDCDGCYDDPVVDSHGWYDPNYVEPDPPDPEVHAYSLVELTETIEFEAAQIPAEGLEISGCAGEQKYYWSDITCGGGGYGVVSWSLTVGGDDAAFLASYIERSRDGTLTIPTDESDITITGAGSVLKPAWDGTVRILMRVDFFEDTESATLATSRSCGVPMAVGDVTITVFPIETEEPTDVIPLEDPETEDPVYGLVEIDVTGGDVLDEVIITVVDTGTTVGTVIVGVGRVPTLEDNDGAVTGSGTIDLTDLGLIDPADIIVLVVGDSETTQVTLTATPTIIPAQTLTIASATHGQTATSPTLEFVPPNVELVIASATHGQSADAITLTDVSTGILEVQSASHGHTASSITLIQHHVLEIQSATHGQTADNLWLGDLTGNILRDSEGNILRDSAGNILRGADA